MNLSEFITFMKLANQFVPLADVFLFLMVDVLFDIILLMMM